MITDTTTLRALFTLMAVPNVGETRIRHLIDAFKSAENVFQVSAADIAALPNFSDNLAEAILTHREPKWVDFQLQFLEQQRIHVITMWDDDYPTPLRTIFDPPPVLFIKGQWRPEDALAIGIVGTRKATHYGSQATKLLSDELARRGITIISGLARGIDTIAHRSALIAGGRTLAVLGCGLDVIYPNENKKLYEEIPLAGALVTTFPIGAKPDAGNFPGRNRIISGLSLGVIVVEAGEKSGALLTANFALDQGRDVFAVPGRITDLGSVGPNNLIKNGAKLITTVDDVLSELRSMPQSITQRKKLEQKPAPQLTPAETHVYQALSTDPKHIDDLSTELAISTPELLGHLLHLELKGAVEQLPGKLFVVC